MVNIDTLIQRDLQHIWHPCSQMKDLNEFPPLVVTHAQGSYLYTDQGALIDAISSWWCKSLGHGHPRIIEAIKGQLDRFEHVIGANTTHPLLVELGEELASITGKQHSFFASDGATAVEIAMKLAVHAQQLRGHPEKNQFIALRNGYHGESWGTMGISDLGIYKAAYMNYAIPCYFINPPYLSGIDSSLWGDCSHYWNALLPDLEKHSNNTCAIILEPIIQGAGGMLCYSADFLSRISHWAKSQNIYLIADEIMTGIGRTGKWLASEHANIQADLVCLSKGLTSGSVPLSCVMIDHSIFEIFYNDYSANSSFLHSNTYSCNPLAVSAALATIKTMKDEDTINQAQHLGQLMKYHLQEVAKQSGKLTNLRGIGAVVAADLIDASDPRIGNLVYQQAIKQGALIRPIGRTLYWMPPLNTQKDIIGKLAEITLNSIDKAYQKSLR